MLTLLVSTCLVLTLGPTVSATPGPPPDGQRIQGLWRATSGEMNGVRQDGKAFGFVAFDATHMTVSNGSERQVSAYHINETTRPRQIDQVIDVGGAPTTLRGIYVLEGDALSVCIQLDPSRTRPTALETQRGDGRILMVLTRAAASEATEPVGLSDADAQALKALGASFDFTPGGQIKTVMLSHTSVTDADLRHLASLTELEALSLFDTGITDAGLAGLAGLRIERLNLTFTRITDAGLGHVASLKKLREIALMGTAVTASGVLQLKDLPDLGEVDVSATRIGRDDLARLRQAMPRCSFLE